MLNRKELFISQIYSYIIILEGDSYMNLNQFRPHLLLTLLEHQIHTFISSELGKAVMYSKIIPAVFLISILDANLTFVLIQRMNCIHFFFEK
jgi:hypothetical protein